MSRREDQAALERFESYLAQCDEHELAPVIWRHDRENLDAVLRLARRGLTVPPSRASLKRRLIKAARASLRL